MLPAGGSRSRDTQGLGKEGHAGEKLGHSAGLWDSQAASSVPAEQKDEGPPVDHRAAEFHLLFHCPHVGLENLDFCRD